MFFFHAGNFRQVGWPEVRVNFWLQYDLDLEET
jgi:hypothetical protein